MEIQKQDNQLQKYQPHLHSQKLIECLIKLENKGIEIKDDGKGELMSIASKLLPEGKPNFLDVVLYPKIKDLSEALGRKTLRKAIFLLLKDFCGSLNVVRNMNEDQMIEGATVLLDECSNFRLEDYVMMFSMAKRGELVKIYDRIDLQVLTSIMDEYWLRRNKAAVDVYEGKNNHYDSLGTTARQIEQLDPASAKMVEAIEGIAAGMSSFKQFKEDLSVEQAKQQIKQNPNYNNPYQKPGE